MAQNNSRTPVWKEDHEADAAKWFQHFVNPMNEANYESLRQVGFEQMHQMDNRPAMKALSSASWQVAATSQQGLVSGRGQCIAFDPTGAMYYGVTEAGLWKSTDNGANWTSLSDSWSTKLIGGVAVDPMNPKTIYAGTGSPAGVPDNLSNGGSDQVGVGVYKSEDGGLNWTLLAKSPQKAATTQMEVNPTNSNIIYYASTGGVSLSDDSGATWKNVLSLGGYTSIVLDPLDPAIVYAAGGGAIEKSLDSGKTWSALPSGYPTGEIMVLGMSRVSSDSIYLSTGVGNQNGSTTAESGSTLALSTDAGQTWTIKSSNENYLGQQAYYANGMAVNPIHPASVVAGGLDIFMSNTGGSNMTLVADWRSSESSPDYAHADIHMLKYNPYTNPPTLFALTDGGIFYSKTNGRQWSPDMNNSLNTLSFVGGDMAVNSSGGPDFFCAGAQDAGLNAATAGVDQNYRLVQEGDGGTMFVSPSDGQTTFGTYVYMTLYRSEDRGLDWDAGGADQNNAQSILGDSALYEQQVYGAPFYMTYDVYDQDPGVVAVCGPKNLFLEPNGNIGPTAYPKVTNTNASNAVSGQVVAVNIASSDDTYIYLGTASNYFYYSTDVGQTWNAALSSKGSKQGFGGGPTGITTDPNDATRVFMTVGGTSSKHFYYSTDNGQTWTTPATNLPALNYRRVAVDQKGIIYVGNDYGVLRSGDTGKTWYPVADGMPTQIVTSLHVRGNYLCAATYGRGMYYVDLTQLAPVSPSSVAASPASSGVAITAVYPSIITTSAARTNVDYTLPSGEQTTLAVYDVLGRQERMLVNEWASQGTHEISADLTGLATGQHYLVLTSNGMSVTKPIVIE